MAQAVPPRPAVLANRRAHQRFSLVGQAATLHLNGQDYLCSIRNISAEGLMAVVYVAGLSGGMGEIELSDGTRVAGSILWSREWQFGFVFDRLLDIDRLLAALGGQAAAPDRRADARISVTCSAKLRVNNRFYFGKITDISRSGARFVTPGRLKAVGDALLFAPDLPPLPSTIRWARSGAFGLEFTEMIPDKALQSWLQDRAARRER